MLISKWCDGIDNYKSHELWQNSVGELFYSLTLEDRHHHTQHNLHDHVKLILSHYDFTKIDLLYSGGLDSELLLVTLMQLGIPVRALTMRLLYKGYPLNICDLYYSEKFSRNHKIDHVFLDLDLEKFYTNGQYLDYLLPYHIVEPHVASHLWCLTQCDNFPVLAGEYTWPWTHQPWLSPHRLEYSCYDLFLRDQGLEGIGNFWNHSFDLNCFMISQHLRSQKTQPMVTDSAHIPLFKQKLYSELCDFDFESRPRSYGWDTAMRQLFDKSRYRAELLRLTRAATGHRVSWQSQLAKILGPSSQSNDKFK